MSGIYRIVTRKPELDSVSAEARVTGAATQNGDPSYAVEGFVNYPLELFGQTLGLRLAAYQLRARALRAAARSTLAAPRNHRNLTVRHIQLSALLNRTAGARK